MKLYKRFAAALLAGIMVLALFTACSSTPPQNPEEQKTIDTVCMIWLYKVWRVVDRELPWDPQLRKAAQDMGEELAATGELITNGVYWGRLDMEVPAGKTAAFMVLTWDKKTPVTYKLDKLLEDAGDGSTWADDATQKMREMMLHALVREERLAKIEQADIAAIKNKDGTYSFVLGYIIAE